MLRNRRVILLLACLIVRAAAFLPAEQEDDIPDGHPHVITHGDGVVKIYSGSKLFIKCPLNESDIIEAEKEVVVVPEGEGEDKDESRTKPLPGLRWFNTTDDGETEILLPEDHEDKSVEMKGTWLYLTAPDDADVEALIGTFDCRFNDRVIASFRSIIALKIKKFDQSYSVTEGEDLKLHCEAEKPHPDAFNISWYYRPLGEKEMRPLAANITEGEEEDHIKTLTKDKVTDAVLKIEDAVFGDRAYYYCVASTSEETVTVGTLVRVKDKYAALWPFLGVVAEVLVLCFIILICERRTVKKEIEEDEPNGTTGGMGEHTAENSALRQRK